MALPIVDRAVKSAHTQTQESLSGRMLRVGTVASLLDLPEKRVYELVRAGVLPHVRIGRSIRFNADTLAAWLDAGGGGYAEDAK